jgi:hypothetical protein
MKAIILLIAWLLLKPSDFWESRYYVKNDTPYALELDVETNYSTNCKKCEHFVIPARSSRLINTDVDIVSQLPSELFKKLDFKILRGSKSDLPMSVPDNLLPEWSSETIDHQVDYTLPITEGDDHHSIFQGKDHKIKITVPQLQL